jgi:hypothetical protein
MTTTRITLRDTDHSSVQEPPSSVLLQLGYGAVMAINDRLTSRGFVKDATCSTVLDQASSWITLLYPHQVVDTNTYIEYVAYMINRFETIAAAGLTQSSRTAFSLELSVHTLADDTEVMQCTVFI